MVVMAISLESSRFFEFKLNEEKTEYWTTDLSENPYYIQFNSYWNEILATGLLPLISLCYMNLKIFRRIKVRPKIFCRLKVSKLDCFRIKIGKFFNS